MATFGPVAPVLAPVLTMAVIPSRVSILLARVPKRTTVVGHDRRDLVYFFGLIGIFLPFHNQDSVMLFTQNHLSRIRHCGYEHRSIGTHVIHDVPWP